MENHCIQRELKDELDQLLYIMIEENHAQSDEMAYQCHIGRRRRADSEPGL